MGHPALEDGGAIPCTAYTQVALHTQTHTNHNAAPFPGDPHEGHSCLRPCLVVLNGRAAAVLARSHLCTPICQAS